MKRILIASLLFITFLNTMACNKSETEIQSTKTIKTMKLKITFGDKVLFADLYDNATARSFIAKLPLTIPMQNLYDREMVYRFPDALPANEPQTSGYQVGDISYWAPRHSFVIFYEQNAEVISNLQKVGRIREGVELFKTTDNTDVKFEVFQE